MRLCYNKQPGHKPDIENHPKGAPMSKRFFTFQNLCFSAVLAALYVALTVLLPFSYGPVQFRISEALTLLPVLFPQSIPGLTLGCLIANLLGSSTPWDVIFGTLTTLLAAIATYRLRQNIWLAAAAPVLGNGVVVGLVLHLTLRFPLVSTMLSVAFGEACVLYLLGVPLVRALKKITLPSWLA